MSWMLKRFMIRGSDVNSGRTESGDAARTCAALLNFRSAVKPRIRDGSGPILTRQAHKLPSRARRPAG